MQVIIVINMATSTEVSRFIVFKRFSEWSGNQLWLYTKWNIVLIAVVFSGMNKSLYGRLNTAQNFEILDSSECYNLVTLIY